LFIEGILKIMLEHKMYLPDSTIRVTVWFEHDVDLSDDDPDYHTEYALIKRVACAEDDILHLLRRDVIKFIEDSCLEHLHD
jgi:hypothetical protein